MHPGVLCLESDTEMIWKDTTFITSEDQRGDGVLTEGKFNEVLAGINEVLGPLRPFTFMPASPEHLAWLCERHPELSICDAE